MFFYNTWAYKITIYFLKETTLAIPSVNTTISLSFCCTFILDSKKIVCPACKSE